MAYEKVVDLSTDTVHKLGGVDAKTGKKNPISIEGYYLGCRMVKSENGESTIHVFQTPKGNEGIWGSADTNTKLGNVTPGTMTNVVFKAKIKIGGGKTKNTFDVFVDNEQTIEVAGKGFNRNSAAEDSYEASDDTTEEYTSDDADEEDAGQEVAAQLAADSAARAAKVQSLLNGKGKKTQ